MKAQTKRSFIILLSVWILIGFAAGLTQITNRCGIISDITNGNGSDSTTESSLVVSGSIDDFSEPEDVLDDISITDILMIALSLLGGSFLFIFLYLSAAIVKRRMKTSKCGCDPRDPDCDCRI